MRDAGVRKNDRIISRSNLQLGTKINGQIIYERI